MRAEPAVASRRHNGCSSTFPSRECWAASPPADSQTERPTCCGNPRTRGSYGCRKVSYSLANSRLNLEAISRFRSLTEFCRIGFWVAAYMARYDTLLVGRQAVILVSTMRLRGPILKVHRAIFLALLVAGICKAQSNSAAVVGSTALIERVKPSVALVLVGEGAGRLSGTASALCVSANGVLLTAYHVVKGAREVQVRLASGEVYDDVQLVGVDSRRDIAAIRIAATDLPVLPVATQDDYKVGEEVYVVSNPKGLAWSASSGILSAFRLADEIPGAGKGFHLLQFSAPVSPGSSGGVLVDGSGRALGIVTSSLAGQNLNFAVPLVNVLGLANGSAAATPFSSGSDLNLPQSGLRGSSQAVAKADPAEILRLARTLAIQSRTAYFTPALLARVLLKESAFNSLGLKVVEDPRVADLIIQVDRPLFTYDFTYTVTSPATSLLLASGKVIAFDGAAAAPKIAKNLMKVFEGAHESKASSDHGR